VLRGPSKATYGRARQGRPAAASDEAHDKVDGTGDERELQKKAEHAGQAPNPKILAKAAAIRPPIRIPRHPPKREGCGACATVGAPFWVMDFSIGAAFGAVLVAGGAA
jgi:hypothetical protein